jgi:hypothetical protein
MAEEHERLRDAKWLAGRLDVDVSCVHRWIRQGKIQVVQLPGGRVRVPDSECRRIMRAGYVGQPERAIPSRTEGNAAHERAMEQLKRAGIG